VAYSWGMVVEAVDWGGFGVVWSDIFEAHDATVEPVLGIHGK